MVSQRQIIKYTVLPGIIPRVIALFKSGFAHLAYMIALIYGNVKLLPPDHPYLNPQNIGRFGIRHAIGEASNHLVFSRRNIDQIVIFFTILVGLALLLAQFVLLITAVLAEQSAYATITATTLFDNPGPAGSRGPDQDIAFIVLDRVFGVSNSSGAAGFFESCVGNLSVACTDMQNTPLASTPSAFPFPFHTGLHRILEFYSYGIFMVGVFVIIYHVINIVSETATTGTPFGQRFNKAWAPVRLILFMAMIIPLSFNGLNQGLNGAQLATFQVVKWGSNLATNGWAYFNGAGTTGSLAANYMSQQKRIVARPEIPEVNDLLQFMHVALTCKRAYHGSYSDQGGLGYDIDAYIVRSSPIFANAATGGGANATPLDGTDFTTARTFSYNGNITIRFGHQAVNGAPNSQGVETPEGAAGPPTITSEYKGFVGNVKPVCGDITLPISNVTEPGALAIYEGYYNMIFDIWTDTTLRDMASCTVSKNLTINNRAECSGTGYLEPTPTLFLDRITTYTNTVQNAVTNGINEQEANGDFDVPNEIIERGWAGAAIWYNRIAAMNGALTSAALNLPKQSKLPVLMEAVARSNRQENANLSVENQFTQNMAEAYGVNVLMDIKHDKDRKILKAMIETHDQWMNNGNVHKSQFTKPTGNIIIDFINAVFGTSGIFEMRRNVDTHPLAQLSSLGKGMMDATMRNAAYGAALAGASGLGLTLDQFVGDAAKPAMGFFFAMVTASIGISVILYYVLPFLPFVYFMFAISGWVKSIFEAVVAMPLWALSHLRIDGEGVPGPGGSNGYFLLLEIFLRPILIIMGFIASIAIFSALVSVLNQIFDLVVSNVGGYAEEIEATGGTGIPAFVSKLAFSRGPVDEFFFTAMYAIICYLMGLACFKLVDLIPNNILRWMGVSVSTFQENAGDPAGQLTSSVYRGTLLASNQVSGRVQGDLAVIMS